MPIAFSESRESKCAACFNFQDYTRKGLFEHLKHHDGMGLISSSEMQSFIDQVIKRQSEGCSERQLFNSLYDGTTPWTMTSSSRAKNESKEKRECVDTNTLVISGFAQPQPFLQTYKTLSGCQDGFMDRLLFCSFKPIALKTAELYEWNDVLDGFNLHGFHGKKYLNQTHTIRFLAKFLLYKNSTFCYW